MTEQENEKDEEGKEEAGIMRIRIHELGWKEMRNQ